MPCHCHRALLLPIPLTVAPFTENYYTCSTSMTSWSKTVAEKRGCLAFEVVKELCDSDVDHNECQIQHTKHAFF